jgi:microcystin-dependent protein
VASPFTGEIRLFAGNFAPAGWAFCDGRLLPIEDFTGLYTLIGTTYGGDGQSTFAVPDLRSKIPVHVGSGFVLGQIAGTESVTLTSSQMPNHNHAVLAYGEAGNQLAPVGNRWASSSANLYSSTTSPAGNMNPNALSFVGGNLPHDNIMPYLALNFIIALFGVFPSQN